MIPMMVRNISGADLGPEHKLSDDRFNTGVGQLTQGHQQDVGDGSIPYRDLQLLRRPVLRGNLDLGEGNYFNKKII